MNQLSAISHQLSAMGPGERPSGSRRHPGTSPSHTQNREPRTQNALSALSAELRPWLYCSLAQAGGLDGLDPDQRAVLRQSYLATTSRNLLTLQELEQLLPALAGARVLLLKGLALLPYYPEIGARPLSDADVLIDPADLVSVRNRLVALGFRPEPVHSLEHDCRFCRELSLSRPSGEGVFRIDLHWGLATQEWLAQDRLPSFEEIWSRSRPAPLGLTNARVPCPEDNLLHLCIHLALHHAFDADVPYVDMALLLKGEGSSFDWGLLLELAERSGWKPAIYLALERARSRTLAPVPDEALEGLRPGRVRRWLVGRLAVGDSHTRSQTGMGEQASRILQLALAGSPRDSLSMAGYALFPPLEWLRSRYRDRPPTGGTALRLLHLARLARLLGRGLRQLLPELEPQEVRR